MIKQFAAEEFFKDKNNLDKFINFLKWEYIISNCATFLQICGTIGNLHLCFKFSIL